MRAKFDQKIEQMVVAKSKNSFLLSKPDYDCVINDLKRITDTGAKNRNDYRKKERYELKLIGGVEKLVKRGTELVFLPSTELFDVVHTTHIQLGNLVSINVLLTYRFLSLPACPRTQRIICRVCQSE